MSVATASARLRVRSTRTISPALPRLTAAIAQAQPTAPTPTIPILLMVASWWRDDRRPYALRARYKDAVAPALVPSCGFQRRRKLPKTALLPHPDRTCPMNAPAQIVPPYRHTPLFPLGKDQTS